jgi:PAS domain-containing protein
MTLLLYASLHGQMRRWAEEMEARKSAEKTRQLWTDAFANCAQGIALELRGAEKVLTCNQAFARLLGFTVAELTGVSVLSTYDAAERGRVEELIAHGNPTLAAQTCPVT